VDLVLPPTEAFFPAGKIYIYGLSFFKLILISIDKGTATMMWPPVLGQGTRQWPDIFKLIHRPEMLWDVYAPLNSIEEMDIEGIWTCYNVGEAVLDAEGHQTGIKPPLRLLEQWFAARWRTSTKVWICHLFHILCAHILMS
jgi:hypothetical protein